MLHAARVGTARMEVPGKFAIGVAELEVLEGDVTATAIRQRSLMWRFQRRMVNRPCQETAVLAEQLVLGWWFAARGR